MPALKLVGRFVKLLSGSAIVMTCDEGMTIAEHFETRQADRPTVVRELHVGRNDYLFRLGQN